MVDLFIAASIPLLLVFGIIGLIVFANSWPRKNKTNKE